jgi:hypothetical protein
VELRAIASIADAWTGAGDALNDLVTRLANNRQSPGSRRIVMTMTSDSAVPDAQLTQAMMDRITRVRPASMAEALRELRAAFPGASLSARVTAVEAAHRVIANAA